MYFFGVDYYPEQWPEERWPQDAYLMSQAAFNVVRLAEFAWSRLEPEEGLFDFDWLDRAIKLLSSHGLQVVLGTPTASPPPWLMSKNEELFRVCEDGSRITYGNRRGYCPNHPQIHEYTRRIVNEMASHYAAFPEVIGWQIDNEFGDRCYCDLCRQKYQNWLFRRYHTIQLLNERWGTAFWSHSYNDWSEIPLPRITGLSPNPGLALDFYRFASDSYVAYQKLQIDILRQLCPRHFVTHNFMGFRYDFIEYFDLARDLDFVSLDIYWRMQWNLLDAVTPSKAALDHDTMRGLKRHNYWVMEQQAGSGGWEVLGAPIRPGDLRLWAYQSMAHGADGIVFFRWRTARFGTEQNWHGILDHHGRPGRRYYEIQQMGIEIQKIGDLVAGAEVRPRVAMILSYDSRFAFQIQPYNPDLSYPNHFHDLYQALFEQQIPIDIVSPENDLTPYQLVIAPALHVLSQDTAVKLERYVEAGGVLLLTPRTGVKDEGNAVVDQPLPGLLAKLAGVQVEEYLSFPPDLTNQVAFDLQGVSMATFTVGIWCDVLKPTSAVVAARYTSDYIADKPAITLNRFGFGQVVYTGALGDKEFYGFLISWVLSQAGITPSLSTPTGVEVSERWQGELCRIFVLNHTDSQQSIHLGRPYRNLIDDVVYRDGGVALAARDVLILVEADSNDEY